MNPNALKISRILHAGYLFECADNRIAFDPIFENPFSTNCFAFPNIEFDHAQISQLQLDAVFISHYHDDHCSLTSLNYLNRNTPIYMYCIHDEMFSLIQKLGFTKVYSLKLNEPIVVGSFTVLPKQALDADVDSVFHIEAMGLNILNVVDSWLDPETLLQLSKTAWDLVLWPFQTMRELEVLTPSRSAPSDGQLPVEFMEQLQQLNPKRIVPSSCQFQQEAWSWYNHAFFPVSYKSFAKQVATLLPNAQVVRMNPGVSFELTSNNMISAKPLSWIAPIGDQNVDYEYNPFFKIPSTSDISKNFPALTEQQAQSIFEYCKHDLIQKYQSLDSGDGYFNKSRVWRLSLFNHAGHAHNFYYLVQSDRIQILSETPSVLSWTTEIPIFKLYSALKKGESLTSLYMRINETVFSDEIEQELKAAEAIEDPLIRCLYNGDFGSYQKNQLLQIHQQNDCSIL